VGGNSNRPGAKAVRVRTMLFWNSGWQSLTNSTLNTGIVLSAGTTALCVALGLKQQAGVGGLTPANLVNKVSGASFLDAGGLTSAGDFLPVLQLVSNALALDQDPLASIGYDAGTYSLTTGTPWIGSLSPAQPVRGGVVTLRGTNLDKLSGRNIFWFGRVKAATWSVSADRATATMSVPADAVCGPFTLQEPNGSFQVIKSMLMIKGTVGTLAGTGKLGYADGYGMNAAFYGPSDVVFDSSSNLYVADMGNRRLRRITPDGTVTTLAGNGATTSLDGVGPNAQFAGLSSLVYDGVGAIYLTEYNNGSKVRKVTLGGQVTTVAGSGTESFLDGPALSAQFYKSYGICMTPNGDLLIGDEYNFRIRRISGGTVSTFAGTGANGTADGPALSAQFNTPCGVQIGRDGTVYVADDSNHTIRSISPTGMVSTIAGLGATPGFADGTGTAARFRNPVGFKLDAAGDLIVCDAVNHAIRRVTPAGVVTTIAGTGVSGYVDGATSSAQFNNPYGVALDAQGNLYVGDYGNHSIRVICP
jgi:sugar lactone lactonase YvrE